MDIVDRIMQARTDYLMAGHPVPNRCRLPPLAAAQLCEWVQSIEHDPFLGFTPIGKRVMGMVFEEDATITEIIVEHV